MKTRVTIETTRNQEVMIGLAGTGELVKASRSECAAYFEGLIQAQLEQLTDQANAFVKAAAAPRTTEG